MLVESIKINLKVPTSSVNFVAMQPCITESCISSDAPFKWIEEAVAYQLKSIKRTLDLAKNGFDGKHTNFTLFPEYSIPGIDGINMVDDSITAQDWADNSVIIAGIDGLTKAEYSFVCENYNVNVSKSNSPDAVPNDNWVNCCITWIKDNDGIVHRFIQPKIRAAWLEMNVPNEDMFRGSTVYLFNANFLQTHLACNFFTLICFDWVAKYEGSTVLEQVIKELDEVSIQAKNSISLHWVFVIQYNEKPNNPSFLESTNKFFMNSDNHYGVERNNAVVIHANASSSQYPIKSGTHAFSACIFSPQSPFDCNGCRPSICMNPKLLRKSEQLSRCKDIVFREMGECIHLFKVIVPRFVSHDAPSRTMPIQLAKVYSTSDENCDPRLNGSQIPASVKWLNDSLDVIDRIDRNDMADCSLNLEAHKIEDDIVNKSRKLDGIKASTTINFASCSYSDNAEIRNKLRRDDVDSWDKIEEDALEHVIHSLTLLGLVNEIEMCSSKLHATLKHGNIYVQVVAIKGDSFSDCINHYRKLVSKTKVDPVMIILQDKSGNSLTDKETKKYYEQINPSTMRIVDYHELVTKCRLADSQEEIRGYINGFINEERKII